MNATINQINKELNSLADAHVQINSYFFGDFLDIYESETVEQTSLLANINNATINQHYVTLKIELMVMSQILNGKENVIDVESDTLQIINDILQVIKYSNKWQKLGKHEGNTEVLKFTEKGGDILNGWYCTLSFQVKKEQQGFCDLPFINYDYE